MHKVTALPTQIHTMYAQLLDNCRDASFLGDFPPTGSFKKITVKTRDYWYYQSSKKMPGTNSQPQKYVGPDNEQTRALIERHARLKDDFTQRRQMVQAFKRFGVSVPSGIAGDLLEHLATLGIFRMQACLVGTFAFQTYEGLLGVKFPKEYSHTKDLDLAQFREISLAVAATDKIPFLLESLKTIDPTFEPLPSLSPKDAPCRFKNREGYAVDLLVPNRGPDKATPEPLPALGASGQLLRYLDFLIHRPVQATVLYGGGILVNVPDPSRFAVHKLIVSQLRQDIPKKAKDMWQASCLLAVLLQYDKHALRDAFTEALSRGPKWRKNLEKALATLHPSLQHPLSSLIPPPTPSPTPTPPRPFSL